MKKIKSTFKIKLKNKCAKIKMMTKIRVIYDFIYI